MYSGIRIFKLTTFITFFIFNCDRSSNIHTDQSSSEDTGIDTDMIERKDIDGFMAKYSRNGHVTWANQIGGYGEDAINDSVFLSDGSIIVTGHFQRNAFLGHKDGKEIRVKDDAIGTFFVAKYSEQGNLIWFRQAHGEAYSFSAGDSLAVLPNDEFFVIGSFWGDTTIGKDDTKETTVKRSVADYRTMIFLAKYNSLGELLWVKQTTPCENSNKIISEIRAKDIAVDRNRNVLATGFFYSCVDLDGSEKAVNKLDSGESQGIFSTLFDENGDILWKVNSTSLNESSEYRTKDTGTGVAALKDGNYVIVGYFENSDFRDEDGNVILTPTKAEQTFVLTIDRAGEFIWGTKIITGLDSVEPYLNIKTMDIADCHDDTIIVTGEYYMTAVLGEGTSSETILETQNDNVGFFVAKYSLDGDLLWSTNASSPDYLFVKSNRVECDEEGDFVVVGDFLGNASLGGNENGEATISSFDINMFFSKYGKDGELSWVKTAGNPAKILAEDGTNVKNLSIHTDGKFLVAGTFRDVAIFGPGEKNETVLSAF